MPIDDAMEELEIEPKKEHKPEIKEEHGDEVTKFFKTYLMGLVRYANKKLRKVSQIDKDYSCFSSICRFTKELSLVMKPIEKKDLISIALEYGDPSVKTLLAETDLADAVPEHLDIWNNPENLIYLEGFISVPDILDESCFYSFKKKITGIFVISSRIMCTYFMEHGAAVRDFLETVGLSDDETLIYERVSTHSVFVKVDEFYSGFPSCDSDMLLEYHNKTGCKELKHIVKDVNLFFDLMRTSMDNGNTISELYSCLKKFNPELLYEE